MRKIKIIAVCVFLSVAFVGGVLCLRPVSPTQVVGRIPPNDLREIECLVRRELRFHILPTLEWDNILHPGYVLGSIKEYRAQRILWAEAQSDGSVDVFAGVSKTVIRSEGHAFTLRKSPAWEITGYAYWASSNVAPANIRVPLSP